jgi:hypothetical protein
MRRSWQGATLIPRRVGKPVQNFPPYRSGLGPAVGMAVSFGSCGGQPRPQDSTNMPEPSIWVPVDPRHQFRLDGPGQHEIGPADGTVPYTGLLSPQLPGRPELHPVIRHERWGRIASRRAAGGIGCGACSVITLSAFALSGGATLVGCRRQIGAVRNRSIVTNTTPGTAERQTSAGAVFIPGAKCSAMTTRWLQSRSRGHSAIAEGGASSISNRVARRHRQRESESRKRLRQPISIRRQLNRYLTASR